MRDNGGRSQVISLREKAVRSKGNKARVLGEQRPAGSPIFLVLALFPGVSRQPDTRTLLTLPACVTNAARCCPNASPASISVTNWHRIVAAVSVRRLS